MPRGAFSRNQLRNLLASDFSHETKSPPDSCHVGSSTNSNQPDRFLVDGSMNLEPRNKKSRSERENLSSPAKSDIFLETPSNNETSGAQQSPPTVPNLQLKFGKKGNNDLPPETNVDCDTRKCQFIGIVYQFLHKQNTKIRISFTVNNALWILGKRAKEEWINYK